MSYTANIPINLSIHKHMLKNMPKVLFWKRKVNPIMHPVQTEFVAISTTGDGNWGELILHKTNISRRTDYNGTSIAIDFMQTNQHSKGLGREMLLFAHNYSKKIGCNGYIFGKADSTFTPQKIPHLIYRKWGFSTEDKKIDCRMDKFIKNGKNATIHDFPSMLMFYPPLQSNKKKSKFYNLYKKFCNLLKNKA